MFVGLYGDLPEEEGKEPPKQKGARGKRRSRGACAPFPVAANAPRAKALATCDSATLTGVGTPPSLLGGKMYGSLYGDIDDKAAAAAAPAVAATISAGPTGAAAAISAAPTATAPKAEAAAGAKKPAWGVPKFMPQQRKRQAPSSTARSAAALAAKKQKLLQERQLLSPDPKAEPEAVRKPLTPAAGGLYSYEVTDEYDPRRPHDYDRLVALRRKQKEIDAKMRVLKASGEAAALLVLVLHPVCLHALRCFLRASSERVSVAGWQRSVSGASGSPRRGCAASRRLRRPASSCRNDLWRRLPGRVSGCRRGRIAASCRLRRVGVGVGGRRCRRG